MTRQSHATRNDEAMKQGWTGLMNSMIGFANASTMFGIQQMQNTLDLITDSRCAVRRFKHTIDSLSRAMSSEIDDPKSSTLENMNRTGENVVRSLASDDDSGQHAHAERSSSHKSAQPSARHTTHSTSHARKRRRSR